MAIRIDNAINKLIRYLIEVDRSAIDDLLQLSRTLSGTFNLIGYESTTTEIA